MGASRILEIGDRVKATKGLEVKLDEIFGEAWSTKVHTITKIEPCEFFPQCPEEDEKNCPCPGRITGIDGKRIFAARVHAGEDDTHELVHLTVPEDETHIDFVFKVLASEIFQISIKIDNLQCVEFEDTACFGIGGGFGLEKERRSRDE